MAHDPRESLNSSDKWRYFYADASYAVLPPPVTPEFQRGLPVLFEHDYVHFRTIEPYAIELPEPHCIGVNIYPHPWNNLFITDQDSGERTTVLWNDFFHPDLPRNPRSDDGIYRRFVLPAGRFIPGPVFSPPLIWVISSRIYHLALLALAGLGLMLGLRAG